MNKKTSLPIVLLFIIAAFLILSGCDILFDDKDDSKNTISGTAYIDPGARYEWGPTLYIGLLDQEIENFLVENNPLSLGNLKKLQQFDTDNIDSVRYEITDFEAGKYWVISFIDVNDDQKLNVNYKGTPKEPLGVYPDNENGEMQQFDLKNYNDINLQVEYLNFEDDYEKDTRNDTAENAKELVFSHTEENVMDTDTLSFDLNFDTGLVSQDYDWFSVDVQAGYRKNIRVYSNSTDVDLIIKVYNDNDEFILESNNTGVGGMEVVSMISDFTPPYKVNIYNNNGNKKGVYYMEWYWDYDNESD